MHIFFNKYHTILICQVLFTLLQEGYEILVCQIAEHPLKPDHIVLVLELELLQSFTVETTYLVSNLIGLGDDKA